MMHWSWTNLFSLIYKPFVWNTNSYCSVSWTTFHLNYINEATLCSRLKIYNFLQIKKLAMFSVAISSFQKGLIHTLDPFVITIESAIDDSHFINQTCNSLSCKPSNNYLTHLWENWKYVANESRNHSWRYLFQYDCVWPG